MTDKQPEALIRAEELEQIGAESSLARAMAAHTIRLLYKENEALRARLSQCDRCGEVNPAEIHTCSPQEPVAWMHDSHVGFNVPLYTAPPQREWQGLTDETEIKHCWYEACQTDLELTSQLVVYFARAIEAKLKEKNT